MVVSPDPYRHEHDKSIHATFLYTTARLHPFSMQLPAVQEGQSMPEAVLRQQHGSWERTRRAPRPQRDGGDAQRAMLPDHATKSIAKKSTTGSLSPAVPLATNVQPVGAHVWRQLHLSAVARFSDSYCIVSHHVPPVTHKGLRLFGIHYKLP